MTNNPDDLKKMTDDQLANVSMGVSGSAVQQSVMMEWQRRMAVENAKAAKAAGSTAKSVKITLCFTGVAAVAAAVAAIAAVVELFAKGG